MTLPLDAMAALYQRRAAPTGSRWETPGEMARDLDPKTVQTPALDIIDEALVEAFNTPDSRLIISMAPQEGKASGRRGGSLHGFCLNARQLA